MSAVRTPAPGALSRAVSAELRAEMARLRVTGQALARKIGRSQNYVAKRLRDDMAMTIDDVEVIAAALGTTYEAVMKHALERMRSS